jgi:CarD family transcriptional regulator
MLGVGDRSSGPGGETGTQGEEKGNGQTVTGLESWPIFGTIVDPPGSWRSSPSKVGRYVTFAVGTKVIYPAHGTAEIVRRTTRTLDGKKVAYLELVVPERGFGTRGDMTVLVPEDKAAELGVRDAISREEADEVLAVLAVTNVRVPTNWSRRFKNHQEKLKSGDVYECAEVVRNLTHRERSGSLSTAEKSMQVRARHILISELSVSWAVDLETAEARVDDVLASSAPVT